MTRLLATLLLVLAAGSTAAQQAPQPAARAPALHLRGGQWFDGERFGPSEWYAVGGRFTRTRPARVDAVVDLTGRWVIPPLAEAHAHDLQNSWNAASNAAAYLRRGVLYTVQMCATPGDVAPYRGFLDGPAAPDVLWADGCISSSDGHPLGMALAGAKAAGMEVKPEDVRDKSYWSVDTPADLATRWDRIAASKPKLIKVILIDAANYAANRANPALFGHNGLDPALVPEIVRRAHGVGAKVAAHIDTADDFARAAGAGVDMVAHLPGYRFARGKTAADYRLSDAAIAEAKRRGTVVITTVAAARYFLQARPGERAALMANHADNLRRLRAAGVRLALGSDVYGGSVVDEVRAVDGLQVMTRPELLRVAVADTPRLLFPDRRVGAFAEGAEASLVALEADPLADLGALERVALVIKRGAVHAP
ncbi:amidohydrolase family protein [Sphingomonas lenta]|uniref:Amidohydrolase-related domain-containing protein n=1 Tax=Sphingomonas lenta TaxID=1141887 RepID=A0A2A2SE90_9SPHN|nr:hypothetical protein [Sphingomonas lenta]PAX07576.1 hypothetical protein CKY28_07930 [Sphingomonas lenta]